MSRIYTDSNGIKVFEFTDYASTDVKNVTYSGGFLSVYNYNGAYYSTYVGSLSSMRFSFSDAVEKNVLFLTSGNGLTAATDQAEWIVGTSGDDSIASKAGDDRIFGGSGNDTYQFSTGNGKDTLTDSSGQNTIKFNNANAADITVQGSASGLEIKYSANDSVILDGNVATFMFADGSSQTKDAFMSSKEIVWQGTDAADTLTASSSNDTLKGGKGNDTLKGEGGNDTYVLYKGDGQDTVLDGSGANKLLFADATVDDVDFKIVNGNLVISYGNTGRDSVTINNYLYDKSLNFSVQFADGQVLQGSSLDNATGTQYWVNVLLSGEHGASNNFGYIFPSSAPSYLSNGDDTIGWTAFSQAEKTAAIASMTSIAQQANVNFAAASSQTAQDVLSFQYVDMSGYAGHAYYPSSSSLGSDVFIGNNMRDDANNVGNPEKYTLTHEILHALGLQHSFGNDYSQYLSASEESADWTIMSYNFDYADYANTGLRAFDTAALQAMYGVETTSRTGNDTYYFNGTKGTFVWDGAGTDTIDASAATQRATLNLNDGSWSYLGNAKTAHISDANQLTINLNSSIEKAIGTAYNDEIIGNAANNTLTGGAGDDILRGGYGNDTLDGGEGNDTLKGGLGIDKLNGGAGADSMAGGLGNDTYYVNHIGDTVTELANEGTDEVISSISFSLDVANGLENLTLSGSASIDGTGNGRANSLSGNNAANVLKGMSNNDILEGKGGADTLDGGSGKDSLNGGAGNDTLIGGIGSDTAIYTVLSANDKTGGNGVDSWTDFKAGNPASNTNADVIDLSDLLIGYGGDGSLGSLSGFLSTSTQGSNTVLNIDRDGSASAFNSTALLSLINVNVNLATLLDNHQVLV